MESDENPFEALDDSDEEEDAEDIVLRNETTALESAVSPQNIAQTSPVKGMMTTQITYTSK